MLKLHFLVHAGRGGERHANTHNGRSKRDVTYREEGRKTHFMQSDTDRNASHLRFIFCCDYGGSEKWMRHCLGRHFHHWPLVYTPPPQKKNES